MSWQYPSLEIQSRRKPLTYLDFQNAFRVTSSSIMSEARKWGAKKAWKKGVLFSLEKANIASVAKRPRNSRKQKKSHVLEIACFSCGILSDYCNIFHNVLPTDFKDSIFVFRCVGKKCKWEQNTGEKLSVDKDCSACDLSLISVSKTEQKILPEHFR